MFRLSLHRIHSLLILPALFPLLFMMAEKQSGFATRGSRRYFRGAW